MSNLATLTDEKGNQLGYKDRYEIEPGESIMISATWLLNSRGEVLLAKRSQQKNHDAGLWGPSAAGTVEPDETVGLNAVKETEEEVGVSGVKLTELHRFHYWNKGGQGRYVVWYFGHLDRPADEFVLQETEVDSVRWVSQEALRTEVTTHPEQFTATQGVWFSALDLLAML